MNYPLLEVNHLSAYIHDTRMRKFVRMVDDVSFAVESGKVLGIFGESGCGKTRTAYCIMGLMPDSPGIIDGEIWLTTGGGESGCRKPVKPPPTPPRGGKEGVGELTTAFKGRENLLQGLDACVNRKPKGEKLVIKKKITKWQQKYEKKMSALRGKTIGLISQGAKSALWPFDTIRNQVEESYRTSGLDEHQASGAAAWLLDELQLIDWADAYPHTLSGGTCQRAITAVVLALNPVLLIADEPTTGLDPPLQVKIIELLKQFVNGKLQFSQPRNEQALIIISHDIKVMAELADTLIVMYAGRVVESGDCSILLGNSARHPYTQMMKSIAQLNVHKSELTPQTLVDLGIVPTMLNLPPGCKFHPRCAKRMDKCKTDEPILEELTANPTVSQPRSDARSHPEHREESRNGISLEKALVAPRKVRCYVSTE